MPTGASAVDLGGGTGGGSLTFTGGATTVNATPLSAGAGAMILNTSTLNLGQSVTGSTITFNNSGAETGSGPVTATTLNLNGTGAIGANGVGNALATSAANISVGSGASAGAIFLNDSGSADLKGTATGNFTLTATGIAIDTAGFNAGANTVTLVNSGALTSAGAGRLTAGTLNLDGAGAMGVSGTPLLVNAANLTLGQTGSPGASFIDDTVPVAVDLAGTANGALTLAANAITIDGAVGFNAGANTVAFANSGLLASGVGASGLLTAGTLNLDGGVGSSVGSGVSSLLTAVNAIQFGPATSVGASFINNGSGGVDVGGSTGGGSLTLNAGATTINTSPLNLGAGNLNLTTTTLNIGQPVTAGVVTLNDSGAVTASGSDLVTATTLNLNSAAGVGASGVGAALNTQAGAIVATGHGRQSLSQSKRWNDFGHRWNDRRRQLTLTAGLTTVNTSALNAGASNVTLNTAALNLGQKVTGSIVTLNNSGAQTGSGQVTATTALDLGGSGALALIVSTPVISLSASGGASSVNDGSRLNSHQRRRHRRKPCSYRGSHGHHGRAWRRQ